MPEPEEPPDGCEETSDPAYNIADHGCITTSHEGQEGPLSAAHVFDDHSGTTWAASHPTPWIAYELADGAEAAVVTYQVTASGHADRSADPAGWELQGSNDDADPEEAAWTTLDVQEGEVFSEAFQTHTYTFSNDAAFRHYRFLVTESAGAEHLRIAELGLFPAGTPVFTVDSAHYGPDENQFSFGGLWNGHDPDPDSGSYHGTTVWNNKKDDTATLKFVGSQVRLFGVLAPHHGILGLSLDGGPEVEADLYAPEVTFNHLVYTSPKLCPGQHDLVARITGTKNPLSTGIFTSIDRAQVIP